MITKSLPQPDETSLATSERLQQQICDEIESAGGAIGFDRFMELALYAPGLGYYAAGQQKFGSGGDFVTAPELTPLFGRALARQVGELLAQLDTGAVIEFGAGSGRLAIDLITQLAEDDLLPSRYLIVEVSAELKHRQQQLIDQEVPQWRDRFEWLDRLPDEASDAVVIANEVLDAMPQQLFQQANGALHEACVACHEESMVLEWRDASLELVNAVEQLGVKLGEEYRSEVNLRLAPWIASLATILKRGAILLVDYGYSRSDYYHPDRYTGTLMCHYRHHAHDDPLLWPGLQDITAHVDFTAVAESAVANNLQVFGYTTQSHFLIGCGIDSLMAQGQADPGSSDWIAQAEAVKRLMLPTEMGEIFKVMALGRGISRPLRGFAFKDMTASL